MISWPRNGIVHQQNFEYEDFEFVARRKTLPCNQTGNKARKTHDDGVWVSEVHLLQHEFDPPIEEILRIKP